MRRSGQLYLLDGRNGRTDDGDSKRNREQCKDEAAEPSDAPI